MTGQTAADEFSFGDSESARLIRSKDWSATPLGPIAGWPQNLKLVTATLLRSTTPLAILWGRDGIMLYNDAFAELAGDRHPVLLGSTVREGWPEVTEFTSEVMRTVLAGESLKYRDLELELHRAGMTTHTWANLDYSPLLDDHGVPAGVFAIVTETTDRVLAERALAARQERLHAMFDQAPGFIAMMEGPEHVFTLINQAYTRLMGPRDVVGRTVRDAVPEAIGQGLVAELDAAYRSGKPFVANSYKFSIPDIHGRLENHYLDFVYQPVRDDKGAVCGIFAQGSDVTERVLAEQALRETRNQYQRLNDALILANDVLAQPAARPAS